MLVPLGTLIDVILPLLNINNIQILFFVFFALLQKHLLCRIIYFNILTPYFAGLVPLNILRYGQSSRCCGLSLISTDMNPCALIQNR
jgi:hypothetical protein